MSYNLVNPTTGALTRVSGNISSNIIPVNASAHNKLVTKSDIVVKHNYSMAGTASLEDDIKTFVTALIALGANTYAGFFNRSGNLGTAGNYSITVYAEEGTSTFASGYIALGAGATGKTQYIVSYYKPTGSSEEWTIQKLVTAAENNFKYQVLETDSDLNNVKTSGTYSIYISDATSQATNHAPTYGWLQLIVIQMNNSQVFCNQILYSADGKMFMRECGNGIWTAWQKLVTESELKTTFALTRVDNNIYTFDLSLLPYANNGLCLINLMGNSNLEGSAVCSIGYYENEWRINSVNTLVDAGNVGTITASISGTTLTISNTGVSYGGSLSVRVGQLF